MERILVKRNPNPAKKTVNITLMLSNIGCIGGESETDEIECNLFITFG